MKAGEASILRADVQSLRSTLEKRELESSQQLAALKNQVKQMDSNHLKQIEASKTEMKFKVKCKICFTVIIRPIH